MELNFNAKAGSRDEAYKSIVNQVHAYLRRTSRTNRNWDIQNTEWKQTELFGGGVMKAHVWVEDSKMGNYNEYIDTVVSDIETKVNTECGNKEK